MLATDLAVALDPSLVLQRQGMTPDPWQAALLRSTDQQTLILANRQAGKSSATAVLAVHTACYEPDSLVLLLAPALRQSQELFLKVMQAYMALGKPVPEREASALRLTLANGSRIVALPGSEATVRGFSGVRLLIIDEASRVDDALYYSVRPMLAVSGGRLVALTTPFGQRGFFWQEWTDGGPDWQRIRVTAYDVPRISRQFLEEERRAMGDRFYRQEYECSFEDNVAQIFSSASIFGAVSPEVGPLFGSTTGEQGGETCQPLFAV